MSAEEAVDRLVMIIKLHDVELADQLSCLTLCTVVSQSWTL